MIKKIVVIAVLAVFTLGTVGCREEKTTGEKIEEAAEDVADDIEDIADDIEDKAN